MIASLPDRRFYLFGLLAAWLLAASSVFANVPGGGTGTGPNVTLTDNGTTVTLSNGILSIPITKSNGEIYAINYTYNNGGGATTTQLLSGGYSGGKFYWSFGGFADTGGSYSYSVVVNPATGDANHAPGDYAEIRILRTSPTDGEVAMHFSMRRGSTGFYVTPIWRHRSSDIAMGTGETRTNIYAGSIFNWMSVDATRNKLMPVSGNPTAIGVPTAPTECSLWTSGIYQGQYEDKYKYSAPLGTQRVWGWSSVGAGGKNVGLWNVLASSESYNGGPLHPELMSHMGTTILNMFNGSHYEMGTDGSFTAGEVWGKVYGPYFVYCNNVSNSLTNPVDASQALYADALAQGTAEAGAWPYDWFFNADYAGPANRGTVTGKIVINDAFNPNATAANLWVGLIQQPATSTGNYDFQQWMKPYQFWVRSDTDGNFTVPAVIAGSNYTLYAFGQGANGTFMSQAQTGGSPQVLEDIPASPFAVTVTGGTTTALGDVTWTPTRVGPTVFEIGYPDRTGHKFKHGEDWWVGDIGPSPTSPSPVWTKFMEFPYDFPSGLNYTVGTSRWTTDWNFIQPTIYSSTGGWGASSSTMTFNLAAAPAGGTQASLYLGIASDYRTALIITVNGTVLVSNGTTITATPSALPSTGFFPAFDDSNSAVREGINGAFSDERINFPGTLLKSGANTIKIAQRLSGTASSQHHAIYDYLRLELTNYVPPAPAGVTVFAGNNNVLVSWPAVPGATSYKILRSTVSAGGYAQLATGVTGPVSGSGPTHATYMDSTAANGTTYYYVVQSTNPVNSSANSAQSPGVTPSSGASVTTPAAPTGLTATPGSGAVTLNWTASSDASLYTVKRSTLTYNGGGTTIPLNTITLTNFVTGTSYTDISVTNGTLYSYSVLATNSAGPSSDSTAAGTTPVAVAPTAAPTNLAATALQNANSGQIRLNWSAVTGAAGYVVQLSTSLNGTYSILSTVSSLTTTNYGLSSNTTYYYKVATMNSGGTSAFVTVSATTPPAAPATPVATPGSSKVTLTWTAATGATSYVIGRSTGVGGPYTTISGSATGTSYVDSTAINGVTYYYVVAATGAGGTGRNSVEASATPVGVTNLFWNGNLSTTWDIATANWLAGGSASLYANGGNVILNDTATTTAVNISGTFSPDSVLVDTTGTYSLSGAGSITGTATLVKSGSGTLTISNSTNDYSGTTTLSGGTLILGSNVSFSTGGIGTGDIVFENGTLSHAFAAANTLVYTNVMSAVSGQAGTVLTPNRFRWNGPVTGAGTLSAAITTAVSRADFQNSFSGFSGSFNLSGTGTVRLGINSLGTSQPLFDAAGWANTTLGVDGVTVTPTITSARTILIGALASTGTTGKLAGGTGGTATYSIGAKNLDTTYAGILSGANTALTKTGSGTLTLAGSNSYAGVTTVSSGKLSVTGSLAGTSGVSVQSGATLNLIGGSIQSGVIHILAGGRLDGRGMLIGPVNNVGKVTCGPSGDLVVNGNVTNTGEIQFAAGNGVSSGLMVVNGDLSLAGTVQIALAPATTFGRYPLVTYSGALSNASALLTGIPGGTTAHLSTTIAGQVDLVIDDSDEDDLPDSWEQSSFENLSQVATGDGDGDGTANLVEYRLNLDPASGNSAFRADFSGHVLIWPSAPGIVFTIKRSHTLDGGNWQTLGTVTGAAGTTATYTDSTSFEKAFYRVEFDP